MSEIFNAMAAKYDTPERIALAQLVTQTLEPYFKDNQHQTLIDIGGGTGLVSLPLAAYIQHLAIWDTAPNMIEVSEKKINQLQLANASATVHDLLQESLQAKADAVLLSLVLLHIPDTAAMMEKLYALLQPGGTLYLVDFLKNPTVSHPLVHNGFDPAALTQLTEAIGFTDTSFTVFHEADHLFMNQPAAMFLAILKKPTE